MPKANVANPKRPYGTDHASEALVVERKPGCVVLRVRDMVQEEHRVRAEPEIVDWLIAKRCPIWITPDGHCEVFLPRTKGGTRLARLTALGPEGVYDPVYRRRLVRVIHDPLDTRRTNLFMAPWMPRFKLDPEPPVPEPEPLARQLAQTPATIEIREVKQFQLVLDGKVVGTFNTAADAALELASRMETKG